MPSPAYAPPVSLLGAALGAILLAGCATPGPNHVYVATAAQGSIDDLGATRSRLENVLAPGEHGLGLAYDFNTDHLFVRVAPAQVIRVIERPSGKVLRNMPLPPELHTEQPADLAIRSSDRHLFALHPDGRAVIELSLFGEFVRRIDLTGLEGPPGGLAYDQKKRRLLVLSTGTPARIGAVAPDGHVTYYVTLAAAVNPVTLGYDSDAEHYFVPLREGSTLGEFDAAGKQVASQPVDGHINAVDAGPRSLVRVF